MTWCWHRWGRWTDSGTLQCVDTADVMGLPIHKDDQHPRVVGTIQERRCDKCGKLALRKERFA